MTGIFAQICRVLVSCKDCDIDISSVVFFVNGKAVTEILINQKNLSPRAITGTCE